MQAPTPETTRAGHSPDYIDKMFRLAVGEAEDLMGMPASPYLYLTNDDHPMTLLLTMWHPLDSKRDAHRLTRIEIDTGAPMRRLIAAIVEHTRTASRMRDWSVALETLGLDPSNPPAWTVRSPRAMPALLPAAAATALNQWRNGQIDAHHLMSMEFSDAMYFDVHGGEVEWKTDSYPRGYACTLGTNVYHVPDMAPSVAREIVGSGDIRRIPGLENLSDEIASGLTVRDAQTAFDGSTVFDINMGECIPLAAAPQGTSLLGPLAISWRGLRLRNSLDHCDRECDHDDEDLWNETELVAYEAINRYFEDRSTRDRRIMEEMMAASVAGELLLGRLRMDAYTAATATVEGKWPNRCVITTPAGEGLEEMRCSMSMPWGPLSLATNRSLDVGCLQLDEETTVALRGARPLKDDDPRQVLARLFDLFSSVDAIEAQITSRVEELVTANLGARNRTRDAAVAEVMGAIEAEVAMLPGGRLWLVDVRHPFEGLPPCIYVTTCDDKTPLVADVNQDSLNVIARRLPAIAGVWFEQIDESDSGFDPVDMGIGPARHRFVVDSADEMTVERAGRHMLRTRRLGLQPGTMLTIRTDRAEPDPD